MRIKKIFIIRYGPLQNIELDIGPGLQIIWGRNEAGKTLTIDAIIKMMLEGKIRDFDRINRINEDPEGFILFEDTEGQEKKISIKKGLQRHMEFAGLDLRNIFVIRDSDLSLKQECGYYKSITDKLTGMNLEKIDGLLKGIKDYGKLTRAESDSDISDNQEYGKIKSLRKSAQSFIIDSNEYVDRAEKLDHDYLELEQIKLRQKINEVEKEIEIAEIKQSWDKFNKISENLNLLNRSTSEYLNLKDFNQSNFGRITELNIELDTLEEQIIEYRKELKKIKSRKDAIDSEAVEIQAIAAPMDNKKKEIDRILNKLEIHNQRKSEEIKETGVFPKILSIIFLVLSLASFPIVYFTTQNILFAFISLGIFLAGFIGMILYIGIAGRGKSKFSSSANTLKSEFRKLGFKIKDLGDIQPVARVFEEKYYKIGQKEEILQDQKKRLEIQISENLAKLKNDEDRKKSLTLERENFFNDHDIHSIEEFREKLLMRSRSESNLLSAIRNMSDLSNTSEIDNDVLEGIDTDFNRLSGKLEGSIEIWKKELENLKPPKDTEIYKDQNIDSDDYNQLKDMLTDLRSKENLIDEDLDDHRNNLNEFQRRFAQLNIEPYLDNYDSIQINTLERLREASGLAERFTENIETDRRMAAEAIKIFEDIKSQEETKISDLFEKIGVSDIFKEITDGKYTNVRFDSSVQSVKVLDEYERELEDTKLSKGAYDQLFLAIRIAIAEEILGEGNGFFIMDDAFLASDSFRTKNQFSILKKLADSGWSILYFSVKDEVRELASKFSKNKVLKI